MHELLARIGPPTVDNWFVVGVVVRVLHILSASLLVGGLLYRRLVLLVGEPERSSDESMRKSWAKWVGIATGVLLVTGLYNTWLYLLSGQYDKLHFTYHAAWGIKFLLALALMALAALLSGRTAVARKLQGNEPKWLNVAIALAVLILVAGAFMRTYAKVPPATTFANEPPPVATAN
jgi:hypothetical protein